MKVMAINGSPRKKWNTAMMLEKALEGAASKGAATDLIHLYDLDFKGCTSCFLCKMLDGTSLGRCGYKDELTPILRQIDGVDALVLGSPIYFGLETGALRSFLERLLFQYLQYSDPPKTLVPNRIKSGIIYTMNAPEEIAEKFGYLEHFKTNQEMMNRFLGESEYITSYETLQFKDYSKVESGMMNVPERLKRREEVFPIDCQKAFDMGARLAEE